MNKTKMGGPVCMLKRSQLHPHPNNPRKNLGDLEELRDSIRAHGIMQNLTVVPTVNEISEKILQSRAFVQILFCVACQLYYSDISSWEGFVDEETKEAHKRMQKILERYGFVMPIYEYKSIIDGTSELYRKEKKR